MAVTKLAHESGALNANAKDKMAALGQLGDSYGAFNALVGAVTLLGLGVTIVFQLHALKQREEEQALERFDKLFARIMTSLENHVSVMADVTKVANHRTPANALVRGKETFRVWSEQIAHDVMGFGAAKQKDGEAPDPSTTLTLEYLRKSYNDLFDEKHEDLAPYWRLLYHAFKTIDKAEIDPAEKGLYADIVRADLTPSQSFLLALNGIGRYGDEFKDLINRYHLLKHMPGRYRKPLEASYRDSAFKDGK